MRIGREYIWNLVKPELAIKLKRNKWNVKIYSQFWQEFANIG